MHTVLVLLHFIDTNFSKYFSFFLYFQEPLVLSSSNPMIENSGLTDIHKQIYGYRESLISAIDCPSNYVNTILKISN